MIIIIITITITIYNFYQASIRLSKWIKKERIALEKETKRQSSLVLEERLRWRESLKDQRKELVERYVDERRLTSNIKPNLVNLFSNPRYKTPNLDHIGNGSLEYEKFLNRNIFGYANDSDDDNDYGYYIDNRIES